MMQLNIDSYFYENVNNKINDDIVKYQQKLEDYLKKYFYRKNKNQSINKLITSIKYSLFSGGKRFRPMLCFFVAKAFAKKYSRIIPWAACIEMIHTYSLIHDDLPAMDNDDYRRGKLTNHKKFGEDMAILTGDALLSEAFFLLANFYPSKIVHKLTYLLSSNISIYGMIGGQVIDLSAKRKKISLKELVHLHSLKTGALIKASVIGSAQILTTDKKKIADLNSYAHNLGIAFQIADDLLDYNEDPKKIEINSFPYVLGIKKCQKKLLFYSGCALKSIEQWDRKADYLRYLIEMNQVRKK